MDMIRVDFLALLIPTKKEEEQEDFLVARLRVGPAEASFTFQW